MANRFVAAMIVAVCAIVMAGELEGRELRPSDHGLEYQLSSSPSPGRKSPEMLSFFGGGGVSSAPSSNVALPKAMNSNDTSWWSNGGIGGGRDGGGGGGGDHVRHVLLVASLVCGVTGVALLVASAFIYLYRYKKQKPSSSSSSSTPPSCDNNNK